MTPGQRRRLDRRYARNEGTKECSRFKREHPELPDLSQLPHPRIQSPDLSAKDYVDWLCYEGYGNKAIRYLETLL